MFKFNKSKVVLTKEGRKVTISTENRGYVEHPPLESHFGAPYFNFTHKLGYSDMPYYNEATILHECVHNWVDENIMGGEGHIMGDTPNVKGQHIVTYVAEEVITMGLEVEYNRRMGAQVDNHYFDQFFAMCYPSERQRNEITEKAMIFIRQCVVAILKFKLINLEDDGYYVKN